MHVFTDSVVAREENNKTRQKEQTPKNAPEAPIAAPSEQHRPNVQIPRPHIWVSSTRVRVTLSAIGAGDFPFLATKNSVVNSHVKAIVPFGRQLGLHHQPF